MNLERETRFGRKDEQLDDVCDMGATLAQRNVALDEEKEECANLQHGDDRDQENLTTTENEQTHPEVVATESVEVHEMLLQEVHLQQDQFVKPSAEMDTNLDTDEVEAMEESKIKL